MLRRWWRLDDSVAPQRVARAAVPLLIVRVIEGLAAWLFFNEFFLSITPIPWVVQGSFVAYFVVNLRLTQHYRRGSTSLILFLTDVFANVAFLALPVAASGGLASPLLLVFPFKAIHYGLVFGQSVAALFMIATGLMVVAVWAVQLMDLLPVIPLALLGPKLAHSAVKFAILGILVVVPLATAWLRNALDSTASSARASTAPLQRDKASLDGHSMVASVLLQVSEAVSRLTRLDEILETVVAIAPQTVDVDYCGILLWDEESGAYRGAVAAGAGPRLGQRFSEMELTAQDMPDYEWVRRLGHCVVVSASETESEHVTSLEVPAVLIAPLLSGDQFYGVMEFARRRTPVGFTQRDLTIADGISRQTAVALQRARLAERSRSLVRAVESTGEGVMISDARGRVIFANEAFARVLGRRLDEVLGSDASSLAGEDSESSWVDGVVRSVRQSGWRGETTAVRKDGSKFPVFLNASLIRDDDGAVSGAVAILRDISEEVHFREQMQRADRLAAVGEMAAGIAHEVNNALAVVFGQTRQYEVRPSEELREALGKVDGQARRIADIVQGVLDFARPHAPHQEPVDLVAIVQQTLDLMRHDVARQGVTLETDLDSDLPPAMADGQQIQQILLNLFGNALQAMADTENPSLCVDVRGVDDQLILRVRDSGPGIPADVAAKIFDPFFSTKSDGNGLGLSVSYAIAQAHGGDLRVHSEVGAGSTFTLVLPIGGDGAALRSGSDERALLVDDDPDVAEALAMMLNAEGLQVTHVSSGDEARAHFDAWDWDVVFLDVRLPGMSGPEIFEELSRTHPKLAPRVAFVTGGVWRSGSRLRDELPPQPILPKPCTQDKLRDVLRQLRGQRRDAA